MDLQSRKLNVIEYLIHLKDERKFRRIEALIMEGKAEVKPETGFIPFSQNQVIERAKLSNQDYLNGNFKSQEELEKESENW